jgi:carboxymethylenebutenolidase
VAVKKGEGAHEVLFSRATIPRWGESIEGWLTRPEERPAPALLISPDAWGITGFTQAFSHRLSRHGFSCLAVEPYSRGGKPPRSLDRDEARDAFRSLPTGRLALDLRAGLDYLRKSGDAEPARIGLLAFGDGGPAALDLAGDPVVRLGGLILLWAPVEATRALTCPVLGLYAALDPATTREMTQELSLAGAVTGVQAEVLTYPNVGHAFVDDERGTFDEAAATDAWSRILGFLQANLQASIGSGEERVP